MSTTLSYLDYIEYITMQNLIFFRFFLFSSVCSEESWLYKSKQLKSVFSLNCESVFIKGVASCYPLDFVKDE